MSEKQAKRARYYERVSYEVRLNAWRNSRPKWWHFRKRKQWKKLKPKMPRIGRKLGKEASYEKRQVD